MFASRTFEEESILSFVPKGKGIGETTISINDFRMNRFEKKEGSLYVMRSNFAPRKDLAEAVTENL